MVNKRNKIEWIEKFGNGIEKIVTEILEKKFNESLNYGYDATDVDEFFDKVNEYLKVILFHCQKKVDEVEMLENEIEKITDEKNQLEREKEILAIENKNLKDQGYGSINSKNQEKYINKKLEEKMNNQQEMIKNLTETIEKLSKRIDVSK
ncbi:MAG: hypothetical protein LBF02_02330 [Mycoplasmataceae bacterium]|nr:hypothetical protein [Mycoplasmataceae bacterium]